MAEKCLTWLPPKKSKKINVLIQNEAEFIINKESVRHSQDKDVLLSQDSKDKRF